MVRRREAQLTQISASLGRGEQGDTINSDHAHKVAAAAAPDNESENWLQKNHFFNG